MANWADSVEAEWLDWYRLTPAQRWDAASQLWETFFMMGGTLDEQPDSQSPFCDAGLSRPLSADGRVGLHIIRRGEDHARMGDQPGLEMALSGEETKERAEDRFYWEPLRRELEALRHQTR